MKEIIRLIIMITMFINSNLRAEVLYKGPEIDSCYESTPHDIHRQNNCLSNAAARSNQQLNSLVQNTSNNIKLTVLGPFNYKDPYDSQSPTIGEVYSQRFLKAQVIWERYKEELCFAIAGQIPEESLTYQQLLEQCQINLNKRHMTEIRAMGVESGK